MRTTAGGLLDGRVRYEQPVDGYRTGIEPVLLAAAVPARTGQRVVEAGTGAGAGLLCLAARVPGVLGVGIEADADMAALARCNLAANALDGIRIDTALLSDWTGAAEFDHAFANPPWHDPAGTRPALPRRRLALHQGGLPLAGWPAALRRLLRGGGTLSLIVPARLGAEAVAAMLGAGFGGLVVVPLWPRAGADARLLVLQGRAGRKGAGRLAAGLVLHEADGRFTPAAEAVLRGGAALRV